MTGRVAYSGVESPAVCSKFYLFQNHKTSKNSNETQAGA